MAANGAHNQSVSQQDAAEKKPKSGPSLSLFYTIFFFPSRSFSFKVVIHLLLDETTDMKTKCCARTKKKGDRSFLEGW